MSTVASVACIITRTSSDPGDFPHPSPTSFAKTHSNLCRTQSFVCLCRRGFAQLSTRWIVERAFRPGWRSADRHSTTLGKEKYEPHPRHLDWHAASDDAQGQTFYFKLQLYGGIKGCSIPGFYTCIASFY